MAEKPQPRGFDVNQPGADRETGIGLFRGLTTDIPGGIVDFMSFITGGAKSAAESAPGNYAGKVVTGSPFLSSLALLDDPAKKLQSVAGSEALETKFFGKAPTEELQTIRDDAALVGSLVGLGEIATMKAANFVGRKISDVFKRADGQIVAVTPDGQQIFVPPEVVGDVPDTSVVENIGGALATSGEMRKRMLLDDIAHGVSKEDSYEQLGAEIDPAFAGDVDKGFRFQIQGIENAKLLPDHFQDFNNGKTGLDIGAPLYNPVFDRTGREIGVQTLGGSKTVTLSEILDYPELFYEYPFLENVEVGRMSDDILGGKAAAAYNVKADGKGLILVKATDNLRDFQKSLLHEIQHAIQDYEPQMMVGSNPQDMTARYGPVSFLSEFEGEKTYYTVFGEAEARVVEDTFENPILLSIPPSQRRTKPRNDLTDRTVPLPDEELVMITDDLSDNALRAVSGGDSAFTSQIQSLMKNAREIRKRTDRESAFNGVASLQRGYPELKMSQLQGYMGGGVNSYAIEHGGDLLHRMMEYGGEFSSNAKTKIKNLTRVLNSPYGFEREIKENAQTNYRFDLETAKKRGEAPKATTLEEFEQNIDKGLGEYAAFHANLPVFNELQLAARNFAVALGRKDYDEARYNLSILNEAIDDGSFDARNLEFDPEFETKASAPGSNFTVLGMLGGSKPVRAAIRSTDPLVTGGIGPFARFTNRRPVDVYHGTGTDFDVFDMSKVNTGEGAQMYGHGLYTSDLEEIGTHYRDNVGAVTDVVADPAVALEERAAGFNSMGLVDEYTEAGEALVQIDPEIVEIDGVPYFFVKETEENANENFLFTELPDTVGPDKSYVNLSQGIFRYMYPDGTSVVTRSKNAAGEQFEHPETGEFGVVVEFMAPSQGKVMKVGMDIDPDTEMLDFHETLDRMHPFVQQRLKYVIDTIMREEPVGQNAILKPDVGMLRNVQKDLNRVIEKGKLSSVDGQGVLDSIARALGVTREHPEISQMLRFAGIRGTRYYTAGSRGRSLEPYERTYNYVVFDDRALDIKEKYRDGGPVISNRGSRDLDRGVAGFIPYMLQ